MIHYDLSLRDYLSLPMASKHTLDALAESPLHAWEAMHLPPDPPSDAMILGAVLDTLLCEPGKLEDRCHLRPATYGDGKKWNGNATECREWMASHIDKPIVPADMLWQARTMETAIRNEPKAAKLLTGMTQVTLTWKDHGLDLKGRPDIVGDRWAADIKSSRSANARAMSSAIHAYRYHVQAAMYQLGLEKNGRECSTFYFIFVDKGERPKVNVRYLAGRALDLGRFIYTHQLGALAECMKADRWPGYSGDGDEIQPIDLPAWAHDVEKLELVIGGQPCTID